MSISNNYINANSQYTENALRPFKKLLGVNILQSVTMETQFKVDNVQQSSCYNVSSPFPYPFNHFSNIGFCYEKAMSNVVRHGADVQLLQIKLTIVYGDSKKTVKKMTTVIDPRMISYDVSHDENLPISLCDLFSN